MLSKKQKGDQTISKAVCDHSRNKALSPERHDRHYDTDEENRYQPGPTLVKMSLRENNQLHERGNNRAAK